jgi:hypothetical protein
MSETTPWKTWVDDQIEDLIKRVAVLENQQGTTADVMDFAKKILHGDETHRQWLINAAAAYINGDAIPPPKGSCTTADAATPEEEVSEAEMSWLRAQVPLGGMTVRDRMTWTVIQEKLDKVIRRAAPQQGRE